ncbi:MAG: glycosyltransferase [Oscillospiraceae bacterium]|nr:glycosyltransferase [Oscillospiraceae bacterium]
MKYLFINSVAGCGSTGRIAAEKCRELMAQGHECVLAYGREMANCDGIQTVRIGTELDYKLHGAMNRVLDNQGFGSKAATRRFLQWVRSYDPDVIWLHNIHGYYLHIGLLFDYLRSSGKKILWTLHDCWAMTGHCAYFDFVGCDRWKTGCHTCPQKKAYPASLVLDNSHWNYQQKKRLFTGISDMTLIVPSHWLESRVKQSFLKEYPVEVVYNTINKSVFKPTPGDFREKHGLEGMYILLGVANVWDERKGLKDFIALSDQLEEDCKIVLVGLSQVQISSLPEAILGLPRTNSVQQLAEIYTAADVYINPSVEETFGMTAMEARCCGTEAIVYRDTACEEVVAQFGGIAVDRGPEHILAAVRSLRKEQDK